MKPIKVLFVCMGNICRSPTAEGVFNKLLDDLGTKHHFVVDSAGTHAYHAGETPDPRAQQTALHRGINLTDIHARKITSSDFETFDHILAMDTDNYQTLLNSSPRKHHHKIKLFLGFSPEHKERDVPDPYYGGQNGFEHVFDLIEDASRHFHRTVLK